MPDASVLGSVSVAESDTGRTARTAMTVIVTRTVDLLVVGSSRKPPWAAIGLAVRELGQFSVMVKDRIRIGRLVDGEGEGVVVQRFDVTTIVRSRPTAALAHVLGAVACSKAVDGVCAISFCHWP